MKLPYGKLKEISERTKLPPAKISDYACARIRPGRKRAKHLEQTLGVKASLWLYGSSDEIKGAILKDSAGKRTDD